MEDDGFYYTVISEDTVIEVTGVESGKIDVSASASGNTLTAKAEIYTGFDLFDKVGICAVYDENGRLLQMQTNELNLECGTTVKTHTFALTDVTSRKLTVKYFIWNSFGTFANCYNDSSIFKGKMADGDSRGILSACYDVTPEVFATGEPAYYMSMKQELPILETEEKIPQIYPDETSASRVCRNLVYCCHTDRTQCENSEWYIFSNASESAKTADHTVGDDGLYSYTSANSLYIDGSPTEYGTFTFMVKATNKFGASCKTYTLVIHKNEVEAFAITTEKLPDGAIDKYYSYTLQTNDPKGDVQWNLLKDAQLPKGIEFDSKSGTLFGTPEEAGTFAVNVEVYNFCGYDKLDFLEGEKCIISASDKEALGKKFYDFGWLNEFERYNLTSNDDGTYTFTVRQGKLEGDPISPRYCRQVIAIPDTINTGTVFIDGDEVYGNVGEQERNNWIVEATTVKLRAVPATGYKFSKWVAKNFAATFADNTNPNTTYTVWIQNQGADVITACFEEDDMPTTANGSLRGMNTKHTMFSKIKRLLSAAES